jgi:transposase
LVRRARMILLAAERLPLSEIARRVGVRRRIVEKWVRRYLVLVEK